MDVSNAALSVIKCSFIWLKLKWHCPFHVLYCQIINIQQHLFFSSILLNLKFINLHNFILRLSMWTKVLISETVLSKTRLTINTCYFKYVTNLDWLKNERLTNIFRVFYKYRHISCLLGVIQVLCISWLKNEYGFINLFMNFWKLFDRTSKVHVYKADPEAKI